MEFWQANAKGIYNSPANLGIQILILGLTAMAASTPAESMRSVTIMPGASDSRAPNITITLFSRYQPHCYAGFRGSQG